MGGVGEAASVTNVYIVPLKGQDRPFKGREETDRLKSIRRRGKTKNEAATPTAQNVPSVSDVGGIKGQR